MTGGPQQGTRPQTGRGEPGYHPAAAADHPPPAAAVRTRHVRRGPPTFASVGAGRAPTGPFVNTRRAAANRVRAVWYESRPPPRLAITKKGCGAGVVRHTALSGGPLPSHRHRSSRPHQRLILEPLRYVISPVFCSSPDRLCDAHQSSSLICGLVARLLFCVNWQPMTSSDTCASRRPIGCASHIDPIPGQAATTRFATGAHGLFHGLWTALPDALHEQFVVYVTSYHVSAGASYNGAKDHEDEHIKSRGATPACAYKRAKRNAGKARGKPDKEGQQKKQARTHASALKPRHDEHAARQECMKSKAEAHTHERAQSCRNTTLQTMQREATQSGKRTRRKDTRERRQRQQWWPINRAREPPRRRRHRRRRRPPRPPRHCWRPRQPERCHLPPQPRHPCY